MQQSVHLLIQPSIHPSQVVNGIFALGRKAQSIGFEGPSLGPEEAAGNQREFTEEQLRAGKPPPPPLFSL